MEKESHFIGILLLLCLHSTLTNSSCRFSQFRCSTGICLETEKLCNGVEDCPEGEDERGNEQYDCTKDSLSDDCSSDTFRCRFGGCIPNSLRCNGVPDCWGGTDEASDFCGATKPIRAKIPITTTRAPKRTTTEFTYTYPPFRASSTTGFTYPPFNPESTSAQPPSAARPTSAVYTYPPFRSSSTTAFTYPPYNAASTKASVVAGPTSSVYTYPPFNRDSTAPPPPAQKFPSLPVLPSSPPRQRVTSTTTSSTRKPPKSGCLPIELGQGQWVSCFVPRIAEEIECDVVYAPEGTSAEITCQRYWLPPETGPNRITRECINNTWTGSSSRLRCTLDCGIGGTAPAPLVAGGKPSEPGKWPWHAGLYEKDGSKISHICGATLITPDAVLTAAHCVTFPSTNTKKEAENLRIYLGKFYRTYNRNDDYVQPRRVRTVHVHKNYNYPTLDNDIAILHLERPANITDFVRPVCMPDEDEHEVSVGEHGTLAGWGSIGDKVYPEDLQEAKLGVQSALACKKNHIVLAKLVRETTFCAGTPNGTSACDGDSGGGLVIPVGNKYYVQGIVSGGVPKAGGSGCDPYYFAAFTKVLKYRRWIDKTLDRIQYDIFQQKMNRH